MSSPDRNKPGFARVTSCGAHIGRGHLREAMREEGYCSHLNTSRSPEVLLGNGEHALRAIDEALDAPQWVVPEHRPPYRRRASPRARVVTECVASYPEEIDPDDTDRVARDVGFRHWVDDTVDFMRREFGEGLVLVVLHLDERYPHVHGFAVGPAAKLNPGMKAEIVDGRRVRLRRARQSLYRAGMAAFQDRYHEQVGKKQGLARYGPRLPRVRSNLQYRALTVAAKIAAKYGETELEDLCRRALGRGECEDVEWRPRSRMR